MPAVMPATWAFLSAMLAIVEDGRGGADLRSWSGATPPVADEAKPYAVARAVGYEVAPESNALQPLSGPEAARVLAFFASDTIVMPTGRPAPEELVLTLERYIARLGSDARFYSNGRWHEYARTNPFGWHGISDATFDGGVIGLNDEVAFIFWVEEED